MYLSDSNYGAVVGVLCPLPTCSETKQIDRALWFSESEVVGSVVVGQELVLAAFATPKGVRTLTGAATIHHQIGQNPRVRRDDAYVACIIGPAHPSLVYGRRRCILYWYSFGCGHLGRTILARYTYTEARRVPRCTLP